MTFSMQKLKDAKWILDSVYTLTEGEWYFCHILSHFDVKKSQMIVGKGGRQKESLMRKILSVSRVGGTGGFFLEK